MAGHEEDPSLEEKATDRFQNILNVHGETLDSIADAKQPWQLNGLIFEIAVSIEGAIGILMGEGEASVKTAWVRQDFKNSQTSHPAPNLQSVTVNFHDSQRTLKDRSLFLVRAAKKMGLKGDEKALEYALNNKLQQFYKIGQTLDLSSKPNDHWRLTEYRQVLSISAEGNISPVLALGGLLEFELHWQISEHDNRDSLSQKLQLPKSVSTDQNSVSVLLQSVVGDLSKVQKEITQIEDCDFEFEKFYVELGLKGEAEFGLARGSALSVGKLVFSKDDDDDDESSTFRLAQGPPSSTVNILSNDPESGVFAFDGTREAPKLTPVLRSTFRRGLKRALKMGYHLAKSASRHHSQQWKLKELEVEFELAANGTVGIATIEGSTALSLDFERKESHVLQAAH